MLAIATYLEKVRWKLQQLWKVQQQVHQLLGNGFNVDVIQFEIMYSLGNEPEPARILFVIFTKCVLHGTFFESSVLFREVCITRIQNTLRNFDFLFRKKNKKQK